MFSRLSIFVNFKKIFNQGLTNYPIGVGINSNNEILVADNHTNFTLTVYSQDGKLINALESKVKHAQCFDVGLMDDGSIVLASKDYRIYVYKYVTTANTGSNNNSGSFHGTSLVQQQQQQQHLSPTAIQQQYEANTFSSSASSTHNQQSSTSSSIDLFNIMANTNINSVNVNSSSDKSNDDDNNLNIYNNNQDQKIIDTFDLFNNINSLANNGEQTTSSTSNDSAKSFYSSLNGNQTDVETTANLLISSLANQIDLM